MILTTNFLTQCTGSFSCLIGNHHNSAWGGLRICIVLERSLNRGRQEEPVTCVWMSWDSHPGLLNSRGGHLTGFPVLPLEAQGQCESHRCIWPCRVSPALRSGSATPPHGALCTDLDRKIVSDSICSFTIIISHAIFKKHLLGSHIPIQPLGMKTNSSSIPNSCQNYIYVSCFSPTRSLSTSRHFHRRIHLLQVQRFLLFPLALCLRGLGCNSVFKSIVSWALTVHQMGLL